MHGCAKSILNRGAWCHGAASMIWKVGGIIVLMDLDLAWGPCAL